MRNLYSEAASGYDGTSRKIYIDGTNYGRRWDEADQAHYDLYLKSLEFDQNRMLQADERLYNSPVAQAARMREAGLNPDLQGISPDQSPNMSISSPVAPAGESRTDRAAKIGGLAKDFLSLLPQAVSMVNSIQGGIMNLQNMRYEQGQKGVESARNTFFDSITSSWFDKEGNILPDVRDNIRKYVRWDTSIPVSYGRKPTRYEAAYWNELDRLVKSSPEKLNEMRYSRGYNAESNRQNFLKLLGAHGANLDDDALVKILQDYNRIVFDADKASHQGVKDAYDANIGLQLKSSGKRKIDSGDTLVGIIEYIMGMLADANLNVSRGSKGFSFGVSK